MRERLTGPLAGSNDFYFYETAQGEVRIIVRTDGETVWLDLARVAQLFERSKGVIARHLDSIFAEGEVSLDASTSWFIVDDGARGPQRKLHYNIDAVLAVGYRVKSERGTQLRQWATHRLRGYLVKGFAVDEEKLQDPQDSAYFSELVLRVRQADVVRRGLPRLF